MAKASCIDLAKVLCFCSVLSRVSFAAGAAGPGLRRREFIERSRLESYEDPTSGAQVSELMNFFDKLSHGFSCHGKAEGFYAEPAYDCRVFHVCETSGEGYTLICPSGSLFDQREGICTAEPGIDCQHADEWSHWNEVAFDSMEATTESCKPKEDALAVLPLLPI